MERSKRIIFVSHCILNQNAKPLGREKSSGTIKELVELFSEAGVGVVQLPCPQLDFNGSGINRKARMKPSHDTKKYRAYCRKTAKLVLKQIEKYLKANYTVLGILGIELSPSCAVYQIENGNRNVPGKGIFIEELEEEMKKKTFQVPIVGVNLNSLYSTIEKIQALLRYS